MKLLYFTFLFVGFSLFNGPIYGQSIPVKLSPFIGNVDESCGTDALHKSKMQSDPLYLSKMTTYENHVKSLSQSFQPKSGTVYKVPIVVHVMSTGNSLTDITEDQIKASIQALNEAYRKVPGTKGDGSGVDMEIEFALAVRDPNGNCTNGINWIDMTGNATYMANGVKRNATGSGISDASLKQEIVWDTEKYYNIWVISEIDDNNGGAGVQGYAYLAGAHGQIYDGTVILSNSFKNPNATSLTHELGHAMNLYHTFEGDEDGTTCPPNASCSADGDLVCDTPPHIRSSGGSCGYTSNTCDGGSSSSLHIHNYLDYSSSSCQNMFTAGQKTRVILALTTTRSSFLESNGNMSLVPITPANVDFTATKSIVCSGETIQFTDHSACSPNTFLTNSGWTGTTFSWSATNGTVTYTSSDQNPTLTFASPGTYNVTLTIVNPSGTSSLTKQGFVIVSSPAIAACTPAGSTNIGNFAYTVNNVTFNNINNSTSVVTNGGYSDFTCSSGTVVAAGETYPLSITLRANSANAEQVEVYIDYNNDGDFDDPGEFIFSGTCPNGTTQTLTTNVLIPTTAVKNTILRMRVIGEAGTIIPSERDCSTKYFAGDVEDYGVYISSKVASVSIAAIPGTTITYGTTTTFNSTPTNGGASPTYKWFLNDELIVGETGSSYSNPSLLDGDRVYNVMTSNLAGVINSPCTSNVITMTVTGPPLSDFTSTNTMGCSGATISFTDQSLLAPTSWSWTFQGGTPATSTAKNPVITYNTPGVYKVTLVASNGSGTGTTKLKTDYITISPSPANICSSITRSNSPAAGIGITNVTLNTIQKSTLYDDAVFQDFSCSDNTVLEENNTYTISVTTGSSNDQWLRVYIDYNDDNIFSGANELVFFPAPDRGTRTGSFTVPSGAVKGKLLRMRVISDFMNTSPGPCVNPQYGQAEDFGIFIQEPPCVSAAISSNPSASSVCVAANTSFSVSVTGSTPSYQWQVSTNGGSSWSNISNTGVYSNVTTSTLTLTNVTSGMNAYQYRCNVTNSCGDIYSNGALLTVKTVPTPTISASGPLTFCSGGSVTLTSSAATGNTWSTGATTKSIIVSSTGNYSVTVTNTGCSATSATSAVTVNPTPAISAGTLTDPTVCGTTNGSIKITGTGSGTINWTGAATGSATGITLPYTISSLGAGTYSITLTSASGCVSNTISPQLNNPAAITPTISASGALTFCSGGSVTLTSSAATGNTWSTGATTKSITVSSTGNYTVSIGSGVCKTTSTTTAVTVNPTPAISAGTLTDPTVCGTTNGSIKITGSGSGTINWTGTATGSATGITLPYTISSLGAGNYSITLTSSNACVSNVVTTQLNDPATTTPTISASGPLTFCSGGSVTLTSSAATGNTWSTGATTKSITVSSTGNYTVSIGSGVCKATSTTTAVTVNPTPAISAGTLTDPTVCGATNGSIKITGTGSGTINWTGAATGSATGITLPYTISSLGAGTYSVTLTSASGCISNTITPQLNNPAAVTPTISASGPLTFCSGGSVTLTSSAATGNTWSTGATTQSITVSSTGNYTVSIGSGVCKATSTTTTVTVNPTPAISAGTLTDPTVCGATNGSIKITGSGSGTINWTGAATGSATGITLPYTISSLGAGNYSITLTSSNACVSNVVTTQLNDPATTTPTISASGPLTFCSGGSVTLTSSAATGNTWSTGATTKSITVSSTDDYSVTTNNGGCSATSAATHVEVNPTPTISAGTLTDPTVCGTTNGSIKITGAGSGTINWTGTATGSATGITLPYTISSLGAGTYSVTLTSASGCVSNTISPQLNNPVVVTPTISASGPLTFCSGGSITLTSSAATGNTWSTGATTESITVSSTGNYTVSIGSGVCKATSTTTAVTVNPTPAISAGTLTDPTVCGATNGSIKITGTGSGTINWTGAATGSATGITLPYTISSLGAGNYSITLTSSNACVSNVVTTQLNDPATTTPTISASGPLTFCSGGSVTLTSSAATGNTWSTGATTKSITVSSTDDYSVTTNNGGCSATSVATHVEVNPTPTISVGTLAPPTVCGTTNGSIQVTGSGSGTINWTGTATGSATGITLPYTISSLGAGAYSITLTSASGCVSNTISPQLNNPTIATPTISANGPLTLCSGEEVILTSSSASGNTWSTGATTESITVSSTGSYTVTVGNGSCSSISLATQVTSVSTPTINTGGLTNPSECGADDASIEITGVGAGTLNWSGTTTGSSSVASLPFTIQNLKGGVFTITLTSLEGCISDVVSAQLDNPAATTPTISANGPLTFCMGENVILTSSSITGNTWSTGETTQSITATTTDNYTVTVDGVGCSATSLVTAVIVNDLPTISLEDFPEVCDYNPAVTLSQGLPAGGIYSGTNVVSGVFDPSIGAGTYPITYTVTENGCSNSATNTITVSACVGIHEEEEDVLSVYPNPSSHSVTIEGNNLTNYETIQLNDITGKLIEEWKVTGTKMIINVSRFAAGSYTINFKNSTSHSVKKIQIL